MSAHRPRTDAGLLSPGELVATRHLIDRVRAGVDAELVAAILFGSKARGQARPDSDVDVLLVWEVLPPDREPQATQAEGIAAEVARTSGVPVTVWSVSLIDLESGRRTPMLVDALADGATLWPRAAPRLRVPFTPPDALRCADALLCRVSEGSGEVAESREAGDWNAVLRRSRDDVVRLCTALLLLEGETRPRRAEAVVRYRDLARRNGGIPPRARPVLDWVEDSFGPEGRDESSAVPPPPVAFRSVAATIDHLFGEVERHGADLARRCSRG
jgi:predicted nucleotidyltransferase